MKNLDLSDFYSDKRRLSYNPSVNSLERKGLKRFLAFDDRFLSVSSAMNKLLEESNGRKIKLLDIGVGDAVYESLIPSYLFEKLEVYGVDISKEQLKRAGKYLKVSKVVNLDSQKLPFKDNFFDIVLVSEVLEHIFYPDRVLAEAERVLAKNGHFILTFPNSGALQIRLSLLFNGFSPLINFSKNKEHIRFFNKNDIISLLSKELKIDYYQGLGSFLFADWNFGRRLIMPRFLEVFGNRFLPQFALGNLLILRK